jgi:tRNA 2-thiouridine synthesizing protein E
MECVDPAITRQISLGSRDYTVNDKNYLRDFDEWDQQFMDWSAAAEKIELSQEHLHVINYLRQIFSKNRQHPVIRILTAEIAYKYGREKGTVKYFHNLFPGGIHQAYQIAGLPMQDSCC